ncbi:MAG: hypothetical protein DRN27_05245 [Thermoplasmata archaeon]|nr:MAG: hypothetical protein DRN27_05245 [Thermoplasmata archaeon]
MIMKIKSIYKVPDGKLLKINADIDETNDTIKDININGDFFAYPEESITELEKILQQKNFKRKDIIKIITTFIESKKVQFIGIDAESLTEAIMRCE